MMHVKKHLVRAYGLTIIEAIVSMAVLGTGIASVAAATAFISERVRWSHERILAADLAESVLEEVRSFGCDPNTVSNPCQRLVDLYSPAEGSTGAGSNPLSFPRLYCWSERREPRLLKGTGANGDTCDGDLDSTLFQVDVFVTTQQSPGTNSVNFRRARLTAGNVPAAPNITLDNVANVRVTVRWNDVRNDNTIIDNSPKHHPRFFVLQTRVTQ